MEFPVRLKALRTEHKLTQEELGNILKLSKQTISCYENKGSFPTQEILLEIVNYFNVSLDYLFGRSNYRNCPVDLPVKNHLDLTGLDDDEKQILQLLVEKFKSNHKK